MIPRTNVMAPVPKDTNKPQNNNMDASDAESFHNPNLAGTINEGNSDSSDEEYQDMVVPGGYSLLPSEPGNHQDESDSDVESGDERDSSLSLQNDSQSHALEGANLEAGVETIPDAVLASEAGSSTPTTHVSESEDMGNPAAREKYPHGKIPSYLHVPSLPKEKEGHLWNEKRTGGKRQTLDKGDESAILKAMSGFQLPPDSIPAWAKNIPEDQWRQKIHNRIVSYGDATYTPSQSFSQGPGESSSGVSPDEQWVAEFPDDA
ncbi:WD repeat-containing protein C2orf86 [Elysia marginata]|uniref:Male-enhanced antigen 1 n=1 Tax=Elysia marginata TaxID=1093978 RepID=A0AAV4H6Q6_9GAST|nr:WD repeat-containing protein C2orf86 [Elysia marginata]